MKLNGKISKPNRKISKLNKSLQVILVNEEYKGNTERIKEPVLVSCTVSEEHLA